VRRSGRDKVIVIGAGPQGLAASAHLLHAGVDVVTLGEPLGFWKRHMPTGMLLRSAWRASFISDPRRAFTLDRYEASTGHAIERPIPLDEFVAYGEWFQRQAVPDVDRRMVESVQPISGRFLVRLEDSEQMVADRVVVAAGIAPFAWRPPTFASLSPDLVSHSFDHSDLSGFAGRRVAVVGGGQSALESAVLLHEAGASVEVLVRAQHVRWMPPLGDSAPRSRLRRAIAFAKWPPTDVGPPGWNWFVAAPDLFHHMPVDGRERIVRHVIPPQAADWVRRRTAGVTITTGRSIRVASATRDRVVMELDDGTKREVDHVLLGTGYRVDVTRFPFLSREILSRLDARGGFPQLRTGMESSVPGLHFLGAPAAATFGPAMRFVTGGAYAARTLTRRILGRAPAPLTFSW
jgi:FAD-dependent urate hydroxylase